MESLQFNSTMDELDNHSEAVFSEIFHNVNESIKKQYLEFTDLGNDLISEVENQHIKQIVLSEFLEYFHNNISPIEDYTNNQDSVELGIKIYNFLCIDFYNTILPSFLESVNVSSFEEFESYYLNNLNGNDAYFKANFVRSIRTIRDNIDKLKGLDKSIGNDKNYQCLLKKYVYYVELMNFGHIDNFLENFFKPVLAKNESDIMWRIS